MYVIITLGKIFCTNGKWDMSSRGFGPNEGEKKSTKNFAEDVV
jgi:hypothetical protein